MRISSQFSGDLQALFVFRVAIQGYQEFLQCHRRAERAAAWLHEQDRGLALANDLLGDAAYQVEYAALAVSAHNNQVWSHLAGMFGNAARHVAHLFGVHVHADPCLRREKLPGHLPEVFFSFFLFSQMPFTMNFLRRVVLNDVDQRHPSLQNLA